MDQLTLLPRPIPYKVGGGWLGPEPSLEKIIVLSQKAWNIKVDRGRPVFFVFSALGGVTDELEAAYKAITTGDLESRRLRAQARLRSIQEHHHRVAYKLFQELGVYNAGRNSKVIDDAFESTLEQINFEFKELGRSLSRLLPIAGMFSPTDTAGFVKARTLACGEMLSTAIMQKLLPCILDADGWHREISYVEATEFMVADTSAGATGAKFLWQESNYRLEHFYAIEAVSAPSGVGPGAATVGPLGYMTEGFVAADENDRVCTLPREGSDLTAIFLAGTNGEAIFLKELDERELRDMSLPELLQWQDDRNSHLIGREAIEAAIAHNVTVVIYDPKKNRQYKFTPARMMVV